MQADAHYPYLIMNLLLSFWRRYCLFLCALPWLGSFAFAAGPSLSTSPDGILINAGVAGQFTLETPRLKMRSDDYDGQKAAVTVTDATHAMLKYPEGLTIEITISGSKIHYNYGQPSDATYGLRFTILVPIRFNADGQYAFASEIYKPFPRLLDKQFLYQGNDGPFRLKDVSGEGFSVQTSGGWQELSDLRLFNWATFAYFFTYEFKAHSGETALDIEIGPLTSDSSAAPNAAPKFIVDRFGQSINRTYSGKITSDQDLKDDIAKDQAYLKGLSEAPRDAFGGMPGSGEKFGLKKTGFFHLGKVGPRDVFVTPEGNAFFQLSVCSFDPYGDHTLVRGREKIFEWLPSTTDNFAAAWYPGMPGVVSFYTTNWVRKYDLPFDPEKWIQLATTRLRKWGFNSSGAFSGRTDAARTPTFPCTPMLPLEVWSAPGFKAMQGIDRMIDPFEPNFEKAVDAAFAKIVAPMANNPYIIGYFLGNEQLFENVIKLVPVQKSDSPSKQKLVQWLNTKYEGKIAKFNTAWAPKAPFTNFDELVNAPLFITTPAAEGDTHQFIDLYLETYYSTVTRLFRKYDPNHLLLGNRWQPGTSNSEKLVRIAAKYMDVISVNYYSYAIDEDFLKRIHSWSNDRPMLLSEWHFTSGERGMGGLREVATQKERGLAYRNYVESSAMLPFVIGSQWFSYSDQPVTGRWFEGFNGEAANIGLVDVADRPYYDFVAECKKTNDAIYDVMFGKRPPFHFDDPRFAAKPAGRKTLIVPRALPGLKLDGTTQNWPGIPPEAISPKNLTMGTHDPDFSASFRLCWDDQNLYVIAEVKDKTPLSNARSGTDLWQGDGLELFIGAESITKPGELLSSDRQLLLGASPTPQSFVANSPTQPQGIKMVTVKGSDGYTIEASIPWAALGIKPESGKEILFDLAVDNADDGKTRTRQWIWNGSDRNSSDRGAWGKARLITN